MAIKTYTEQLESVQAAIAAIEDGAQEYTISTGAGSRTVKRADLSTLYDREQRLHPLAARKTSTRKSVRYGVPIS